MVNHIVFKRLPQGGASITVDDVPVLLGPSLDIRGHSPTGFEFGYGGSGPAQSALAILLHVLGKRNADDAWPGGDAERVYQRFKDEFVGSIGHDVQSAELVVDVEAWADSTLAAQPV